MKIFNRKEKYQESANDFLKYTKSDSFKSGNKSFILVLHILDFMELEDLKI